MIVLFDNLSKNRVQLEELRKSLGYEYLQTLSLQSNKLTWSQLEPIIGNAGSSDQEQR